MSFQELQTQNIDTNTINHLPYPPTGTSGSTTTRILILGNYTLTSAQIVGGYAFCDSNGPCTVTLPSAADLNTLLGFTIFDGTGSQPAQTWSMWFGIGSTDSPAAGPVTFTPGTGMTLQNHGPMATSGLIYFRYATGNQFTVAY